LSLKDRGELTITDKRMTRFMISLDQAVKLVWDVFEDMIGGEIYVKKIPSMKVTDIAKVIAPKAKHKIIGIRAGEKLHEQMISSDDANLTYEYSNYYKILPQINEWVKDNLRIKNGKKVSEGFVYSSDNNSKWMTESELKAWIKYNQKEIDKI
jgi:UDP-N-acetylglucosamine 4,6-dehydratase/5-epimerase